MTSLLDEQVCIDTDNKKTGQNKESEYKKKMFEMGDSPEANFIKYCCRDKENMKDKVHCFCEGKDDYKYYISKISNYTIKNTVNYPCGSKEEVLKVYELITNGSKKINDVETLFFIDKDFDENTGIDDNIYITPCYSIENFYVMDETIENFLTGEININPILEEEEYEKAKAFYIEKRDEFIQKTALLNAWYSLQRRKSSTENYADLSAIKDVYSRRLRKGITLEKLKSLTYNFIEVSEEELKVEKERLLEQPIYNFRGKYFEQFNYRILNEILTDSNEAIHIFSKKRHTNISLGKDNMVSILSQYAYTPPCLKKYLHNRLSNQTNSEDKTILAR